MASINLCELTYRTAVALGTVYTGYATAGTTLSISDSTARTEADDYWNNGTAWILFDAGGSGDAPQGQQQRISDFANTDGVITVDTAFTVAPAVGDQYAVANRRYPLNILNQMVNQALRDLGTIPCPDETTATVASQTEYSLPSVDANMDLRRIYYQSKTTDANDNQWTELFDWWIKPSDIGTAHLLVVPQYAASHNLLIIWNRVHPTLRIYTDKLSEYVHPNLVVYGATLHALMWKKTRSGESETAFNESINYVSNQLEDAKRRYPIRGPNKRNKFRIIGSEGILSNVDSDEGWPAISP